MKAYKFLAAGARGRFSDAPWPVPTGNLPGGWLAADGTPEECRHGVHACTAEQLLDWLDDELWEVELDAPIRNGSAGVVATRGRLLRRLTDWDAPLAGAFADRCADEARRHVEHALRRLGDTATADALGRARTLAEVKAVAANASARGSAVAELTAFAADCLLLATGARPDADFPAPAAARGRTAAAVAANLGFVAAHVVGRAAAAGGDDAYEAAVAAERARQLAWLRDRLAV